MYFNGRIGGSNPPNVGSIPTIRATIIGHFVNIVCILTTWKT